jgi:hypothetical protein
MATTILIALSGQSSDRICCFLSVTHFMCVTRQAVAAISLVYDY